MEVEPASATLPQAAPAITTTTMGFPSFTSASSSKSRKFRRRPVEDDDEPTPTPATGAGTTITTAAITTTPSLPSLATTTDTASVIPPAPPSPQSSSAEGSEPTPSLTEILRLRKKIARTSALRGLEVSAPKHTPQAPAQNPEVDESAAVKVATEVELEAVVNRFTHQTGQILDVDKHMMAYIESEMSKRRGQQGGDGSGGGGNAGVSGGGGSGGGNASGGVGEEGTKSAYWTPVVPEGRGATLGKLHEVDLGEEAKKHNIARTQEATRRLQGGEEIEDDLSTAPSTSTTNNIPGRKKLKNRRRRNSQDVQRDKLVEEVLKESRLEMYTDPDPTEDQRESEGAADDRIAEKFRREFLDALMTRRRRRGGDGKKKRDENKKPRGPKLGGSRQARAAMRESQNAAAGGSGTGKKKK
ncbi:unnamed protein product [Tuber melanosporum]|uniref:(Perigord truffle) hypothetical protein n=1 Tax=Tuber melanosporum (strain Mel28) TaxID=656061 RepID=D5GFB4_TUBMM|nr:uncharacterized protein GSTUM_00006810001 [Tuber melanosporum]CAZ83207.1 unnamed protein product [Tuber melanosporum]